MKKKLTALIAIMLMAVMMVGTYSFAAGQTKTVYLPKHPGWADCLTSRSGAYSSVYAGNNSVWPADGGIDLYSTIKVQIFAQTPGGLMSISDSVSLREGSGNRLISLHDNGLLNIKAIDFRFYGNNNNLDAYANVYYDGR